MVKPPMSCALHVCSCFQLQCWFFALDLKLAIVPLDPYCIQPTYILFNVLRGCLLPSSMQTGSPRAWGSYVCIKNKRLNLWLIPLQDSGIKRDNYQLFKLGIHSSLASLPFSASSILSCFRMHCLHAGWFQKNVCVNGFTPLNACHTRHLNMHTKKDDEVWTSSNDPIFALDIEKGH